MKKAAILSLTLFYLLLSTGMYICLMHCAAADVIRISFTEPKPPAEKMTMAGMPCCHKPAKKNTQKETGGCHQHGNYLVKENIKPAIAAALPVVTGAAVTTITNYRPSQTRILALAADKPRGPTPPLISGRTYLIQLRILLI